MPVTGSGCRDHSSAPFTRYRSKHLTRGRRTAQVGSQTKIQTELRRDLNNRRLSGDLTDSGLEVPADLGAAVEILELLESPLGLGMLGAPAGPLGASCHEPLTFFVEVLARRRDASPSDALEVV